MASPPSKNPRPELKKTVDASAKVAPGKKNDEQPDWAAARQTAAAAAEQAQAAAAAATEAAAKAVAVMNKTRNVLEESGVGAARTAKEKRQEAAKAAKEAKKEATAAAKQENKQRKVVKLSRQQELWSDLWRLLEKSGWTVRYLHGNHRVPFYCPANVEPKKPFKRYADYFDTKVKVARHLISQAQQGIRVAVQHAAGALALAEAYMAQLDVRSTKRVPPKKPTSRSENRPSGWSSGSAEADKKAKDWFDTHKKGEKLTDEVLQDILSTWNHNKNQNRINVMRKGTPFVHSEMLGLIRIRAYNKMVMAQKSRIFPNVTKALCRYLEDNPPEGLPKGKRFPFTSICLNKDYAASRHRDVNNAGLTIVRAFGNFTGGTLKHWPKDPGPRFVNDVNTLPEEEAVEHDVAGKSVVVDSTQAHEVQAFQGTRYSLVYYTVPNYQRAEPALREELQELCSLHVPDFDQAQKIWAIWGFSLAEKDKTKKIVKKKVKKKVKEGDKDTNKQTKAEAKPEAKKGTKTHAKQEGKEPTNAAAKKTAPMKEAKSPGKAGAKQTEEPRNQKQQKQKKTKEEAAAAAGTGKASELPAQKKARTN